MDFSLAESMLFLNLGWMVINIYLTILYTGRVAYYQHGGDMPFLLYVIFGIGFFFMNGILIILAVFLWVVLGVRMFPVFAPKD